MQTYKTRNVHMWVLFSYLKWQIPTNLYQDFSTNPSFPSHLQAHPQIALLICWSGSTNQKQNPPHERDLYTQNFPKRHGRIKMVSTQYEGNLPCRGGRVCLFKLWCLLLKESYVQLVTIVARFELSLWLRTNELVAGKYPGLYNPAGHHWQACRC